MDQSLHRLRGRLDVALDLIGRAVVAHTYDETPESEAILEGLCVATRELAAVAALLDEKLRLEAVAQSPDGPQMRRVPGVLLDLRA